MAPPSTAPRGAADWQRIDAALERLHLLAQSVGEVAAFETAVLDELHELGLSGTALWRTKGEAAELVRLGDSQAPPSAEVGVLVAQCLASRQARQIGRVAVAPWSLSGSTAGALSAVLDPSTGADQQAVQLRLLEGVAEICGAFSTRWQAETAGQRLEIFSRAAPVIIVLQASLDLATIAQRLASEGRLAIGCDRVAVALRRGGRYRVLAASGAEHLHRQSPTLRLLERLCHAVAWGGEPLDYEAAGSGVSQGAGANGPAHSPELPPELSRPLSDYLDAAPAVAVAIWPLHATPSAAAGPAAPEPPNEHQATTAGPSSASGPPLGVLVCEQYSAPLSAGSRGVIQALLPHAALALARGDLVQQIPARGLWFALARSGVWRSLALRALLLALLVGGLIAGLALTPAEIELHAAGEVQNAARRELFAPSDALAIDVRAEHGQRVAAGEILVVLQSAEQEQELAVTRGALATGRKQIDAVRSQRLQSRAGDPQARAKEAQLTAEEEQLQTQLKTLEDKLARQKARLRELTIKSPVAGAVVTWNVRERLAGRPLVRGDHLLSLASPQGPWRLELHVPGRSAGRVLAAAQGAAGGHAVSWKLLSQPGQSFTAQVTQVGQRLELDEAGQPHLRLLVELPDPPPGLTAGSLVAARVQCGSGSLAEAWFHDLFDTVQLWLAW